MSKRWDEDPAQDTDEDFTVACGGCGFPYLRVTHEQWHDADLAPCPFCGAGADLVHARRHVSCPVCEDGGG